jgi:hypothetical protein
MSGRTGRIAVGLTQEEFQKLLARAAERHGQQGPHDFSVEELVSAGQELGIDAQTVREVHLEHQRERERALARPPVRQMPYDSRLRLERGGDTLCLTIPPRTSATVGAVVVTTMATAGVAVMAYNGPPPWILGTGALLATAMSYMTIKHAQTTRELQLHRDGSGMLIRRVGSGKRRGIPLRAGQIHARLDVEVVTSQDGTTRTPFVALDHGTETHQLMKGYSHAEQAWAVEEIERWLGR